MGIDKSWMSLRNRASNEYEKGIDIFLDFAFKRLGNVKRIRCPCAKCSNVRFKSRTEVKYDLFRNGILQSYTKWHHHGELSDESSSESDAEDVNITEMGPTTNPNARKRNEGNKGKVEISKRLGRAVGGLQLSEFITEMGVVLRQYAPLNVNKWAEVPMHYKDKMWADLTEKYDGLAGFRDEVMYNFNHMYRDWRHRKHLYYNQFLTDEERLQNCPDDIAESDWASLVEYFSSEPFKRMSARNKENRAKQSASSICGRKSFASVLHDMRDPVTDVDPDLTEYWKATHQRRTDSSWCSDKAKDAMLQFEHVRNLQEEHGDPPLSTEEHLTKSFGARSGYLRGLGCGPKPLISKNLEAKASKEAIERQIEDLKNELKQSKEENQQREASFQKEKDDREERFKKELEDIKAQCKAEFNKQLKIIVQLYGAPTTSSPPSTQNH